MIDCSLRKVLKMVRKVLDCSLRKVLRTQGLSDTRDIEENRMRKGESGGGRVETRELRGHREAIESGKEKGSQGR